MNNRIARNSSSPRGYSLLIGLAASILILQPVGSGAATLPSGFSETLVTGGLPAATAMAVAPDGRIFVCLQAGQVRIVKEGTLLATPFATINVDSSGERGLLGIAFDPDFGINGFVYLYYTVNTSPRHNRVVRFRAKGDLAVPGSETLIFRLPDLSGATNHNGGAIHFGPDGKLYIAVGENANRSNSQTLSNVLGKILRVNADGSVPADNPFFGTASGQNRAIWTLGLRNPYTFAFQPGTARMFINDVGESTWEEINDGVSGSNYGWPDTEGPTNDPRFRSPIFAYGRSPSSTGGCAITGGTFYNPPATQFPANFVGKYFFADYCSGWIRILDPANGTATGFATGIGNPVDLQVAADGTVYYLARGGGGQLLRIQHNAAPPPASVPPPNDNFANAQAIAGAAGIVSGRNTGATKESGEPNHASDIGGRSVWYSWTAPVSGPITFDSRGSGFDTLLAVYQGNGVGGLTALASNDDILATVLQSRVTFTATAGMPYRIALDGFRGTAGQLVIRWAGAGGSSEFNADGRADLIWQNNVTGQRIIWFLNGSNKIGEQYLPTIGTEWNIAGTGDFDGGGQSDIIWENTNTGRRVVWFMNGASKTGEVDLPLIPTQWQIAATGEFNNDGKLDLIWQNLSTGQRIVWFMNGANKVGEQYLPTIPTEWRIAGTDDFNSDGQTDLIWQNLTTGQRVVWFLEGAAKGGEVYLPAIATQWQIAGTADFSSDGQADIIWQNTSTGQRVVWFMNGTDKVGEQYLPNVSTAWAIRNH